MMKDRAARASKIRTRYRTLQGSLTERARRLFVANEAIAFGYGGIVAAARAHLEPHAFHGEWNYTIHPTGTR